MPWLQFIKKFSFFWSGLWTLVCDLICYIASLVWSGRGWGFDLVKVNLWEFRYITISKMLFNMSLDVDVSLHTVPPQQHTVCSNAISTSMLSDSAVPHHNMSSQCCSAAVILIGTGNLCRYLHRHHPHSTLLSPSYHRSPAHNMPTSCHNTLNHGLGHNLQSYICPWWVIIFKYFDDYHSDSPSARFKHVEVLLTSLWL